MGVMHCDLKPEIFLFVNQMKDAPLKTIDFGLSIFFWPGTLLLWDLVLLNLDRKNKVHPFLCIFLLLKHLVVCLATHSREHFNPKSTNSREQVLCCIWSESNFQHHNWTLSFCRKHFYDGDPVELLQLHHSISWRIVPLIDCWSLYISLMHTVLQYLCMSTQLVLLDCVKCLHMACLRESMI